MHKYKTLFTAAVIGLSTSIVAVPALAGPQPIFPNQGYQRHDDHRSRDRHREVRRHHKPSWMRHGGRMPRGHRGHAVDYRRHHLNKPPRGYHWVRYDDEYVLIAISTGIIAGIIAATR